MKEPVFLIARVVVSALHLADGEPSRCTVINNADLRNLCLSIENADSSYCRRIRDPDMRRWCRTQSNDYSHEEEEPGLRTEDSAVKIFAAAPPGLTEALSLNTLRPVDRHGGLGDQSSGNAVALTGQWRVTAAGLDLARCASHSLRAGCCHDMRIPSRSGDCADLKEA